MKSIGQWKPLQQQPMWGVAALRDAFLQVKKPFFILKKNGDLGVGWGGIGEIGAGPSRDGGFDLLGYIPGVAPEDLGDSQFCSDYGLKYPLIGGSMAHGISSADIVETLGKNGMMAFYGAAGQSLEAVESTIDRVSQSLGDLPYGFNLIHSPNEPKHEEAVAELFIRRGVKLIEASAFLAMTLPLIRYRLHGIHQDENGRIITPNRVLAKVSRVEVATKFFSPAPQKLIAELVQRGHLTQEQARLAEKIPVAQDLTAEADSGGHTDNRPAITLLPTMLAARDRLQEQFKYGFPLRVGAAGGIATPLSASAAFAMGAAYLMTGSVNQSCIESGVSPAAREMLAQAQQADVAMAPAGDMFEMGVTVQVLKRGTMFPMRAAKLYELYRSCSGLEGISLNDRTSLEKTVFQAPLEEIWRQTREFFLKRDPAQVQEAEKNPKHLMALVFRWYLGQSPRWAVRGEASRKVDFQIWCGPAMGAFNEWVKGTFMEPAGNRRMAEVALNLLFGAAVYQRLQNAKVMGISLPEDFFRLPPFTQDQISNYLQS